MLEYAAEHLRVGTHAIQKTAGRAQGALLVWVSGAGGQVLRKYRDLYVDMGPRPGPDLPHAWQGHSPQELLGEARQRHANSGAAEGLSDGAR